MKILHGIIIRFPFFPVFFPSAVIPAELINVSIACDRINAYSLFMRPAVENTTMRTLLYKMYVICRKKRLYLFLVRGRIVRDIGDWGVNIFPTMMMH